MRTGKPLTQYKYQYRYFGRGYRPHNLYSKHGQGRAYTRFNGTRLVRRTVDGVMELLGLTEFFMMRGR